MTFLRRVFLTVGTTSFDSLIQAVDTDAFLRAIADCGCEELVLQIGRGAYVPNFLNPEQCKKHGVKLFDFFRFKPTLAEDFSSADLIISHCGAGSVLEAVSLRKVLIVVINNSLQENHQEELASAMVARNYCLQASVKHPSGGDLIEVLQGLAGRFRSASSIKGGNSHSSDARSSASSDAKSLLSVAGLQEYPDADLQAFPAAVDSLFAF
jgi:beta-1,4-N-acetylglucosaminyltransferase